MSVVNIAKEKLLSFFIEKKLTILCKSNQNKEHLLVQSKVASGFNLWLSAYFAKTKNPILFILADKEKASRTVDELEFFGDKEKIIYFPDTGQAAYANEEVDNANLVYRTQAQKKLSFARDFIIVTTTRALYEKLPNNKTFAKLSIKVRVGEQFPIQSLGEKLFNLGFNRVDFVNEPGDFAIRGGILDVFSFAETQPYRLVYFDDEIEKIKQFDISSQLSINDVHEIQIFSNLTKSEENSERQSLLEILPKESLLVLDDSRRIEQQFVDMFVAAKQIYASLEETVIRKTEPKKLFLSKAEFIEQKMQFSTLELQTEEAKLITNQTPQPAHSKKFDILIEELSEYKKKGYKNLIACQNEKQANRLFELLQDEDKILYTPWMGELQNGFVDHELKILFYSDHEIFNRFLRVKDRKAFVKTEQLTLKELTNLHMGDYVTHIDYGIGKFSGLKKIEVNGKTQEAIKLVYQNNDILYVNIHSLHKISKFSGADGKVPSISKLGSPAWTKLKNKTKSKVKELAFDLIKLYAKRITKKGFAFDPDSYLQKELEASFIYEDTPDQASATESVKMDMEKSIPMDRLICGDVGFGKTEVAIRAAFKAVDNSKQVAVLVPTTILAFQHYHSFKKRLKELPVRVDYLNRFRTAKEKKAILEDVKSGKIDILIGTHQIINKSIEWKDIGLLIVDEEHKFGVSVKENLKTLRENLDTLTLTATPIPRTLQFSLMSARDLSIIKTSPPNRQPIDTILRSFNEEIIRDAVMKELERGGQVFFVHNRVENIKEVAGLINRLVPDAKIAIGHGQMDGNKLEQIFLDFMAGEYDILVSTTIIESGLDVPNANTIIINDAHRFGLADLHQMRGRVGRSNKKAYCLLLAPPLDFVNKEAAVRLKAITQFSDLGSGFNIATKDLEIRGSGDLLGAEQSGFINEMGFDSYQKILMEAVEELKKEDFKDLFDSKEHSYTKETFLDTDLNLLIPDDYVNNVEERMSLYNEINDLKNEAELELFKVKLLDRFGTFPEEVNNLFYGLIVKWLAADVGFEKVVAQDQIFLGYFTRDPKSNYFQTEKFGKILKYVQLHSKRMRLKEKKTKENTPYLMLRIDKMESMKDIYNELVNMKDFVILGVI